MTIIAAWPVVIRDRIVQAFKPGGSPDAEAPIRTLRSHAWVSQGVRVTLFSSHGLAGQLTFFSSLNVMAARFAWRGNPLGAALVPPLVWPVRLRTWRRALSSQSCAVCCQNFRIVRQSR